MTTTRTTSRYQWIVDRARSGEPVAIDVERWDFQRILDFLMGIDGSGLAISSPCSPKRSKATSAITPR